MTPTPPKGYRVLKRKRRATREDVFYAPWFGGGWNMWIASSPSDEAYYIAVKKAKESR